MKQALKLVDPPKAPRVGDKLIEARLITNDERRIMLTEQKKTGERLGEIAVRLGFIEEEELLSFLSARSGTRRIDLGANPPDRDLLSLIPSDIARRCRAVVVAYDAPRLILAMADPYDVRAKDEVRRTFPPSTEIEACIASASDIAALLESWSSSSSVIEKILAELESEVESEAEAPVVRLTNQILSEAIQRGASDIHIEPEANLINIRLRIDGVLHRVRCLHTQYWGALSQRVKLMAGLDIADNRSAQDGRFTFTFCNRKIDCRTALLPTVHGENIVIRLLDQKRGLKPLASLGFSSNSIEALVRILDRPQGLTIVTGPTGSGKTTTLYSLLARINSPEVHIATLEDPVEYQMEMIRQTSVSDNARLDFSTAVRAVLRQDPDIIFIGEIRDADSAAMALRSALTGHQVFATLHCNDVWGAVPRLIDLGLSREMLAGNLSGIIAQRLVRKLCDRCKILSPASREECALICTDPDTPPQIAVPSGCAHCSETGRKGRTVVAEVLPISSILDELILRNASRAELLQAAKNEGFVPLQQDGANRVLSGEVATSDLRRACDMTRGWGQ